ncbi:MAG: type II secretion system protein GspD [Kiritimatiellia bacterium]
MKSHRSIMVLSLAAALAGALASPAAAHTEAVQTAAEPVVIESVFVRDMALRDFAELMTRGCESEWKVLVSEQAGDKRISFYLSDTGIEETLRSICATYGLWYRQAPRSDIVQIITMDEYRKGLNLYADEAVEVVPVMYPAPEEIGDTLARLFQDRVVWDPPPEDIADDMPHIESALDRMDTMADRATLVDTENLDGTGGSSSSSSSSSYRWRSDDSWSRSDRYGRGSRSDRYGRGYGSGRHGGGTGRSGEEQTVEQVVEQQRRAMEAQQAAKGIPEDLAGRNDRPGLVYISASRSANALILRSSDAASVETIKNVIRDLDKPKPQILLEVKVLDIQLGDEEARGVDWLFQRELNSDGVMLSGGRATGITTEPGNVIRSSDPLSLVPQGTGLDTLAAVFSVVSDEVRARLQLLEDQRRVRTLATPSLLVADNEASRIFIGSEVTVLEKVEPETSFIGTENPQPVTTYTVTSPRKRIGTTLLITPKIHADRTVTIRLLQEETQLGAQRTIAYGQTASDQFTSQDVEERSVTTTVLAKDGNTIAIGGLIRERAEERETGVPVLMHIPLLGQLFKRTVRSETRSELLVLIQPRILLAPGEGETVSRAAMERAARSAEELGRKWRDFEKSAEEHAKEVSDAE